MGDAFTAVIASLSALLSAALAFGAKVLLDHRRAHRQKQERFETVLREDTGKIVGQVIDGSTEDRKQALSALKEAVDLWKKEARKAREDAERWERRAQEWAQEAKQNRLEYDAMKQSLDEEQRRTSQLEAKVERLEQQLAQEQRHRRVLQNDALENYARKSTPAPPSDDRNGGE